MEYVINSSDAWRIILNIRKLKGTNAKKNALSGFPDMNKYLLYAYNPYWQYNINTSRATASVGNDDFTDATFDLLNKLAQRELSGYAAANALRKHLTNLNYASGELLRCIINKSLDIGLAAKGINDIWPGLIPEHMIQLAKLFEESKVVYPCYVSPKLDGLRAIFKQGKFYSRRGHELQGLSTLAEIVAERLPYFEVLDGELMVPGEHFNEISGQIRSFKETPNAVYNVFDVPSMPATFHARYRRLTEAFINSYENPRVVLVHHWLKQDYVSVMAAYAQAREDGFEGLMVKDPSAFYKNTRSWDWMKLKNASTMDLKVIGTYEGQGKYEGLCGGLYVKLDDVLVSVGSGLSDRQRVAWADDPDAIIGKVIEVAYQEITPDGSLRHPRLITVRGDL